MFIALVIWLVLMNVGCIANGIEPTLNPVNFFGLLNWVVIGFIVYSGYYACKQVDKEKAQKEQREKEAIEKIRKLEDLAISLQERIILRAEIILGQKTAQDMYEFDKTHMTIDLFMRLPASEIKEVLNQEEKLEDWVRKAHQLGNTQLEELYRERLLEFKRVYLRPMAINL